MVDLYDERNRLLNKATSYKGIDNADTIKVRTLCFLEADRLTGLLEKQWAEASIAPPVDFNLYNMQGEITHMLLKDDGITRKYVRINNYIPGEVDINPMNKLERLRYHELRASQEELNFKQDIQELAKVWC